MAHDVFISHSSRDKPAADAVCNVLERNGVRCWIAPRDVLAGRDWASSIVEAIDGARLFLLVFSASSNASSQVAREVALAIERGRTIVPFRIEAVSPSASMEYYLRMPHWLDAFPPPLDQHLDRLANDVLYLLDREKRPPPPLPPPLPLPSLRWVLIGLALVLVAAIGVGVTLLTRPAIDGVCSDLSPSTLESDKDRVSAFSYRNNGSNAPTDRREWSRVKPDLWMERDNKAVKFLLVRRETQVGSCNGSIVSSTDEPKLELFISRKNCGAHRLMFRRLPACEWIGLPPMEEVE